MKNFKKVLALALVFALSLSLFASAAEFTDANPGKFAKVNEAVMSRADEPASQLTYYLFKNKSKKNIPGILKRSWAGGVTVKVKTCFKHCKSVLLNFTEKLLASIAVIIHACYLHGIFDRKRACRVL